MGGVLTAFVEAVAATVRGGDLAPVVFVYTLGLMAPILFGFAILISQVSQFCSAHLDEGAYRFSVAVAFGGGVAALTTFAVRPVGAAASPVVALSGLCGAALAFRALRRIRLVVPRWSVRVLLMSLPAATWGLFSLYDLSPPPLPFFAACLIAAFAAASFLPSRWAIALGERWGFVAVIGVLASAAGITLATFDGQNAAAEMINRHGFVATRLVSVWQSLADRDRDGFSTILGGGDCDDSNPKVGPAECAMRTGKEREDSPRRHGNTEGTREDKRTGAGPDAGVLPIAGEKPNIILITVDAMRADHLGVYGYARPTSPNLDRFARDHAVVFKWAFAADTKTKPSVPALFAGRYASTLNWTKPRYVPLRPGNRLIAERLREAGYHTAGIATHTYFAKYNHINQGFEHWDTSLVSTDDEVAFGRPTSHLVTDKLLAYLASPKRPARPLFLWAHYFDPHQKYLAHPEFASFGARTIDRYDQEIAFTDKHLGRLFDALARRADWGRTIVVVTADHGEAFGEHGHRFHGETLHNEQLRVPLIFRVPGELPRVVDRPVSLIDIAPTLAFHAGLPRDPLFHGTNLFESNAAIRPVFAELLPENHIQGQKAMIDGAFKLIYHEARNSFVMFNYVVDPAEKKNLVRSDAARFASMRGTLLKWTTGLPKWSEMGEPP